MNEISKRSDFQGFQQTLFHVTCLLISASLIYLGQITSSPVLFCFGFILHAFFLSFLFMPLHESVHLTPFRSKILNQVKKISFLEGER